MALSDLIYFYFLMELRHLEIVMFLNEDGINISMSMLHRHLKSSGLFRWKTHSDLLDVALLQEQLDQYGVRHRYKFMHLKYFRMGFVVSQKTVRYLVKILDPQGIQLRLQNHLKQHVYRNPGHNFLWHINLYDKLKSD